MATSSLHITNESGIIIRSVLDDLNNTQCVQLDNFNNIFFSSQKTLIDFANTILALTKEQ